MKYFGTRIWMYLLLLGLSSGMSKLLMAQPYLARYQWLPGNVPLSAEVGHSHWDLRERGLLQAGSVQIVGMPQAALALTSLQENGQPKGTILLTDASASSQLSWLGARPLRNEAGDIFLAANQVDNGITTGLLIHMPGFEQVEAVRRWEGVEIKDVLLDEDSSLVAIGQGIDVYGQSDLRMLRFDPNQPEAVGRSWGNSDADGATRLIDLPGEGEYLMVGWQAIGNNRYPLVARMTGNYDMAWYQAYPLSYPVSEVSDAAVLGDRIAITGTALVPGTNDSVAFLLLLNEVGQVLVCHYFTQPEGQPMRGRAIAAINPAVGGYKGWIIGGGWRDSLGASYERTWLIRTDLEGSAKWARSYYRPAGDVDLSESVTSLHYHPNQDLFLATGQQEVYDQGQWTHTHSLVIKGNPAGGEVRAGVDHCSELIEVIASDEKVVGFKQGQLWATPGTQDGTLQLQLGSVASMFCAMPLRPATSIEVPEAAYGRQQVQYFDLQGRLLHQAELAASQAPQVPEHLPRGIYLLRRFVNGQWVETRKVMRP
jgi:hypothetical protein